MNDYPQQQEHDSITEREYEELDNLGEDIPESCEECGMVTLGGILQCECDDEDDDDDV